MANEGNDATQPALRWHVELGCGAEFFVEYDEDAFQLLEGYDQRLQKGLEVDRRRRYAQTIAYVEAGAEPISTGLTSRNAGAKQTEAEYVWFVVCAEAIQRPVNRR